MYNQEVVYPVHQLAYVLLDSSKRWFYFSLASLECDDQKMYVFYTSIKFIRDITHPKTESEQLVDPYVILIGYRSCSSRNSSLLDSGSDMYSSSVD